MARVCISGYFDPVHVGHLEMLKIAAKLAEGQLTTQHGELLGRKSVFHADLTEKKQGELIIIVVSGGQSAFMPVDERVSIVASFGYADRILVANDAPGELERLIQSIEPVYYVGDCDNIISATEAFCVQNGIKYVPISISKFNKISWMGRLYRDSGPSRTSRFGSTGKLLRQPVQMPICA